MAFPTFNFLKLAIKCHKFQYGSPKWLFQLPLTNRVIVTTPFQYGSPKWLFQPLLSDLFNSYIEVCFNTAHLNGFSNLDMLFEEELLSETGFNTAHLNGFSNFDQSIPNTVPRATGFNTAHLNGFSNNQRAGSSWQIRQVSIRLT